MSTQSKLSRQDRVLEELRRTTATSLPAGIDALSGLDATAVACTLALDRTNVSKELNALCRAGQLIKLQGKPTRFLHRITLAGAFPGCFLPSTVPLGTSLSQYLMQAALPAERENELSGLERSIGANGSLRTAVEQAKAAVTYPPRGLHTLITGSAGVGKIRFARLMYEYAVQHGKLASDAPFLSFNCQDYAGAPQLMMAQLFGHGKGAVSGVEKSRRGLIEQAAGGILYLDGVQKLPPKVQELLATLIEKNTFSRMGEASVTRSGDLMLIAASTAPIGTAEIAQFTRSMPVLIPLPDLGDRGPLELLEHLSLFFSREAKATGVHFRIHKDILACLVSAPCPGQIGELKSWVKIICSLAYLEYSGSATPSGIMEIGYRHLPGAVTSHLTGAASNPEVNALFSRFRQDFLLFTPGEYPILPLSPVEEDEKPEDAGELPDSEWNAERMDSYIERCVGRLHTRDTSADLNNIPAAIYECVQRLFLNHPSYQAVEQNPGLLHGFLLHLKGAVTRCSSGLPPASGPRGDLRYTNPQEYAAAVELRNALVQAMGITLPDGELDFIAMYLYLALKWAGASRVGLLCVLHGEGVAQGLATYVNASYDARLIRAIPYDNTTALDVLLEQVSQAACEEDQGAGVLLMTDLEPLTELHHHVATFGIRAETVSSISLPLMLDLAGKALRGGFSLPALAEAGRRAVPAAAGAIDGALGSSFLTRIIDEILSTSLTYLNPRKAAEILLLVLSNTLTELNLSYSDEIAVKFIFHCSHMLERVIRGDALKYTGLRGFINAHGALMFLLERQLAYAGEAFGVTVPPCELAYVAEIFLPFSA